MIKRLWDNFIIPMRYETVMYRVLSAAQRAKKVCDCGEYAATCWASYHAGISRWLCSRCMRTFDRKIQTPCLVCMEGGQFTIAHSMIEEPYGEGTYGTVSIPVCVCCDRVLDRTVRPRDLRL